MYLDKNEDPYPILEFCCYIPILISFQSIDHRGNTLL